MVAIRARHSSIISRPKRVDKSPFISFILRAAQIADECPVWSPVPYARDRVLREFWKSEDILKTAIFATVARYAAMEWSVVGPPLLRAAAHDMLNQVEDGKGMPALISKV